MRGFGLIRNLFKGGGGDDRPVAERRNVARIDAREGLRILIVDDSSTVVALLGKMLRQSGYEVLEAVDGEQAIETALRERPDLVFLDIVLPNMSGFAVLRALRRDASTQATPVIMISGNLRATEEFYGQRIGADDFMKKPFGRTEVFNRIQALVERGRLPRREGEPDAVDDLAATDDGLDDLVHDGGQDAQAASADIANDPAGSGIDITPLQNDAAHRFDAVDGPAADTRAPLPDGRLAGEWPGDQGDPDASGDPAVRRP